NTSDSGQSTTSTTRPVDIVHFDGILSFSISPLFYLPCLHPLCDPSVLLEFNSRVLQFGGGGAGAQEQYVLLLFRCLFLSFQSFKLAPDCTAMSVLFRWEPCLLCMGRDWSCPIDGSDVNWFAVVSFHVLSLLISYTMGRF
ncbi:hypothetical protein PRIPAC_75498, partial [Pristionchus pacificus]|uniref:Uncharacterized protein n=1 Tax=Pristionchus pacificus TaxID=54126 RepID=A0A2A6BFG4_PRIPA